MELSKRLQAVADLVTAGYKVADIGTDHGYIPIYLVQRGKTPSAIAMDVNKGPLDMAYGHIVECGLEEKIALRLSDGFSALQPGEAQSAVIAGMGGALVIRLLEQGNVNGLGFCECILQPQSELRRVRSYLLKKGYHFLQEDMVEEGGKYYPMMKVAPPGREGEPALEQESWSEEELRYGRFLLRTKNPVLFAFLRREALIKEKILSSLEQSGSERGKERKEAVQEELLYVQKGLEYYDL